jgi:hypothetical protein
VICGGPSDEVVVDTCLKGGWLLSKW